MLIQFGCNLNAVDKVGANAAFYAVRYMQKPTTKILVESGIDLTQRKNNGNSLIHEAAIYDSVECLVYLASMGVPIDLKNNRFKTPLQLAERKQKPRTYSALVNLEKAIIYRNAMNERDGEEV